MQIGRNTFQILDLIMEGLVVALAVLLGITQRYQTVLCDDKFADLVHQSV